MTQIQLTQSDDGKTLHLALGTSLRVSLAENPTTGYRWTIDPIEPPVIALLRDQYTIAPAVGLGGGGTRHFLFRAVRSGEARLSLRHVQAWAPSSAMNLVVVLIVE